MKMNEAKQFLDKLNDQIASKEQMYDGTNRDLDLAYTQQLAIEELGKVAAATIRSRFLLAQAECIDLAHTALLIYLAIERKMKI